jgi:mono/diheme cytochrome c family protein
VPADAPLRAGVIELMQALQLGTLRGLHALGLAPDVHGQPGWPFGARIATETLAIDGSLARACALLLAAALMALLFVVGALLWRRARWPLVSAAALMLVAVPWPSRSLLLTEATPTSFHRAPGAFEAVSIEQGLVLYQSRCAACHGNDGRGEGPQAASLPVWPPRLGGALLWKRAEGELFWRIQHGLRDRHGAPTMPGFAGEFSDAQVWALIDAMKALAAGDSVRREAAWSQPVRAPDAAVLCEGRAPRRIAELRGQRLRVVAAGAALPREDPRLLTVVLGRDPRIACSIDDAAARRAYARVAGADDAAFSGAQLIVDRDGWLRAYGPPGRGGWTKADLLCRSDTALMVTAAPQDGLGDLIAAMDADPVVTHDR